MNDAIKIVMMKNCNDFQVCTCPKMTEKLLHLWRQSQKSAPPNQKLFFECNVLGWQIRLSHWTALQLNWRRS